MCYLCDENNGDYVSCQDCGVAICFDAQPGDEYPEPAGVTASGDLFCLRHAIQYDEEAEENNWDDMDAYFDLYCGELDSEDEE